MAEIASSMPQIISVLLDRIAHPTRANQIIYIASKAILRATT